MTRVLSFPNGEQKNQKRFALLYAAIITPGKEPRGNIEIVRREARILDALDAVSRVDEQAKHEAPGTRIVQYGQSVEMDQADFELLLNRLKTTQWLPLAARDVVDAVDWCSAAPERKA